MNDFAHLSSQAAITHWSWTIAFFLWFAGISGMGILAYYWVRRRAMAYMCLITAVVGTLLVASHLTRWWNLPAALFHTLMNFSFNFGSWMLLGILLLCVHCVFAGLIAAHHFGISQRWPQFKWLGWIDQLANDSRVLIAAAAVGVLVTIYSGFLLTQAIGVPLWNTALIPALWVVSAGAAVLAVIELFSLKGWVDHSVAAFGQKLALG
ncbi:MAG: NrfD/PsrC family molybdoenzyme membrane anchor subunit, partial [Burkholderiaceae bacterium]